MALLESISLVNTQAVDPHRQMCEVWLENFEEALQCFPELDLFTTDGNGQFFPGCAPIVSGLNSEGCRLEEHVKRALEIWAYVEEPDLSPCFIQRRVAFQDRGFEAYSRQGD